jgi:hypothetical protein
MSSRQLKRMRMIDPVLLWLLVGWLAAGPARAEERFAFVIPGDDAAATATDFSQLNRKPAGADGFVTIRDGHFHTAGGRLRIWGVNTCFGGSFPPHDVAEKIAAHLAKLGVNGVRMHHHDTYGAPRGVWGKLVAGRRTFDPDQLDRQDYFLAELHRRGIYANLNLHVSRTFTEAEGFVAKDLPQAVRYDKYLLYYEPRMRKLFRDFCRMYLTHRNPYRKLRRADDPGIAMLEITNENAFSTRGPAIAASLGEPYRGEFRRQWNAWLKARYQTTAALKAAWLAALPAGQSVEEGSVEIPLRGSAAEARRDCRQFMVDTEKGFIREVVAFLKHDLGVQCPITASQITYHGAEIVAETCDYADIHAYWQHPRFPVRPWDRDNWNIANTPMERAPGRDALTGRAAWRLFDRPFTLSEWNIPNPHDCAASVVPFAAMLAALQDWDGVFFFQYHSSEKGWFDDELMSYFSFNGQPVKLALLAACANLYRRGDLGPLAEKAAGTLTEHLPAAMALSRRIGIDPKAAGPAAVQPPAARRLATPDGAVVWDATDPARAHVTIRTPASRAAWGLIAGQTIQLGKLKISVGPAERHYAAIVLTSLDGRPLEESRRMLLAAVGSAENRNMGWNAERTSVGRNWGTGPTQVNGIAATLELAGRIASVHALDGRGTRAKALPLKTSGGATRFAIGPEHKTLWYEVVGE